MSVKLGVNIDHIATLRQARRADEPDPIAAAKVAKTAGADMIVCHLRKDRRHIQEEDLKLLRKQVKAPVHLEIAADEDAVRAAIETKVHSVCIVPEQPGEVTTQGGLRLNGDNSKALESAIEKLKKAGIGISIFVDPEPAAIRAAYKLGADTVELCTSGYAGATGKKAQEEELERLALAGHLAHELGLAFHAGHDLTYDNVGPVAKIPHLEALNIGFSIISRSVFTGLRQAVSEMRGLLNTKDRK
jgi:pyridoxine 5-phosphate synthase